MTGSDPVEGGSGATCRCRAQIRQSLVATDMDRDGLMQTQNAYTVPTRNPESKKPSREDWAKCLNSLVGRE